MGLRTATVLGLDRLARDATELEDLRAAGVTIEVVPLDEGPVFHNIERPEGRLQICYGPSDPVDSDAVPDAWRDAGAWLYAPVAAELPDAWAIVPRPEACVAFGWQGMLRRLVAGNPVERRPPGPSPILGRATIVGMSRHDVPPSLPFDELASWLAPEVEVLMTAGTLGGMLIRIERGGLSALSYYPAVRARVEVDPTGAGDVALAAFLAARIAVEGNTSGRRALHLVALATSVLVEGPGLGAVATLDQIRDRLAQHLPSDPW
jgi:sugar/nucleoside kinase (ribokinase family)